MADELVTEPQAPKRRGRPPGSTTKPAAKAAAKKNDFTKPLIEIVDTVAAVPTAIGLQTENDTLLADGYAIKHHGRNIAVAVNDLAQVKPEVAAALERLGKSTPYAALAMAVLPLALQVVANHVPKFKGLPTTIPTEHLANAARQEIQAEAEAYEAAYGAAE